MPDNNIDPWEEAVSDYDDVLKKEEEPSFLDEAGEAVEELAYGFEKSRWLAGNAARYVAAGGDEELLKEREKERLAEIEASSSLTKEQKESGWAMAGEIGGTLLDPSAIALGYAGVAAKVGQSVNAAKAANALITGSVATGDYALSELAIGEDVDPVIATISAVVPGGISAWATKRPKLIADAIGEASEEITPAMAGKVPELKRASSVVPPAPNKTDDTLIDKLYSDFNSFNPSRIDALQEVQTNGLKLGSSIKIQRVFNNETKRRKAGKKPRLTDAEFERLGTMNGQATTFLNNSGPMLAKQAETLAEGVEGVAGALKQEGKFNANMLRRAIYRPLIGAIGGVGVGYSMNWASDDEMEADTIIQYGLVGLFGGAASKAFMKSNKLSADEINMATTEISKIVKANNLSLFDNILVGSSAAKANAQGGRAATVGKTLFAQRGTNLRGAASVSVEEAKDLALQELNFSWSKVIDEADVVKKGRIVSMFSPDAKGIREAAYRYAEDFVDEYKLIDEGFSETEITTIQKLAGEASSRVQTMTDEVLSTGITMKQNIKGYVLPQFHDIAKIISNEDKARKAYKNAYRIQAKANTPDKIGKADSYIDTWIDDIISGEGANKYTSAWDGSKLNTVLRPLTSHFEKPRMFQDLGARLQIEEFLVKDIDQVYRQYVDNTVPIMEFARKFGPKGEALAAIKKETMEGFSTALKRANSSQRKELVKARDGQLTAIDEMVNDYFGFIGASSGRAQSEFAQSTMSVFVTGANVARLGKVTITSLADLVQPFQNSGVAASLKSLGRRTDFAKQTGFAQRDVLGDELRQYALEVKKPGSRIQQSSRAINEEFFKRIGLTKLTSYARKFAYNSGVERGFTAAGKLSKGKGGTSLRNEANSIGLTDEYAQVLSRFDSVGDAFEDVDGRRILNIIGTKSADRDALIPQIGNRRAFSKSKDPLVRGLGQFLSWAQAKTTQLNSLVTRMEDGDDALFVRSLGAIAIVNGVETFKGWLNDPNGAKLDIDQDSYLDKYNTLESWGKATGRTGNFNNYLIDKVANLAASGERFEVDDAWPALDWATDLYRGVPKAYADIEYGDTEGALVEASRVLPLGKEIRGLYEGISGETLEDTPNRQRKPVMPRYAKGGEVLDVPNAPSEPDQRIDKMTGMPYDQQAGTAFTDQEDRQDPLQRMGFGLGGSVQQDPLRRMGFVGGGLGKLVKMGVKAFKSLDDEVVEELPMKNTDELIEEGKQMAKALEDGGDEADLLKAGKDIKAFDEEDAIASAGMTADDIKNWQELNKLPENKRQKQRPEIVEKLESVLRGDASYDDYVSEVDELFPPTLYTKESAPKFPSLVEVRGGVGSKALAEKGRGIVGADVKVEEGRRVSSRLDIPAYDLRGVWAVTLHNPKNKGGKAFAYGQTSVLKNVDFTTNPKDALNIALGQSKGTIARMEGDWVNHNPRSIYNKAIDLLESDEWVQVGMNPFKHSYFYDKKTMRPVVSAKEVIQVGPLVLVKKKGMKTSSPNDPMFKVNLEELKNKKSKAPLTIMAQEGKVNIPSVPFNKGGKVLNSLRSKLNNV